MGNCMKTKEDYRRARTMPPEEADEEICNLNDLKRSWKRRSSIRKLTLTGYDESQKNETKVHLNKNLLTFSLLEDLELVDNCLNKIPKKYPDSLKSLKLAKNSLKKIPTIKQSSKELKQIDLSENRISRMSTDLQRLSSLTQLNLQENDLKKLSKEAFIGFENLQTLNLAQNKIERISVSLKYFSNLVTLDLSYNKISELPYEFFDVRESRLSFLNLNDNPLTILPGSIERLRSLHLLDISRTLISELPLNLCKLDLEVFEVSVENIKIPNEFIVRQGFKAIKRFLTEKMAEQDGRVVTNWEALTSRRGIHLTRIIKIDFRQIEFDHSEEITTFELNQILENTLSLQELCIFKSNLRDLPFCLPSSIVRVDLSDNQISEIPDNIKNAYSLKELNLSCNKIKVFSQVLSRVPLETLNMSDNFIDTIETNSLYSMSCLRFLNLAQNNIQAIPFSLSLFTRLEVLNLSFNKIKLLSPQFFDVDAIKLETLLLNNNPLKNLPDNIGKVYTLKILELHDTRITHFPLSLTALVDLENLTVPLDYIVVPPPEIAIKGIHDIWNHLNILELNSEHIEVIEPESPVKEELKISASPRERKRKVATRLFEETKTVLNKTEYVNSKNVLNELNPELREPLVKFIDEEEDLNNVVQTLKSIVTVLEKFLSAPRKSPNIWVNTYYYYNRIFKYSGANLILKYVGFSVNANSKNNVYCNIKFSSDKNSKMHPSNVKNRATLTMLEISKFFKQFELDHLKELCNNQFGF